MDSFYSNNPYSTPEIILRSAAIVPGQPFDVLNSADINDACDKHNVHFGKQPNAIYNPFITLWAMTFQALSAAKDCATAVASIVIVRVLLDLGASSHNTGAYCIARAKLPVPLVRDITELVGDRLEDQAPPEWQWKGRRCVLVDGTTVSGPDTTANQKAFPQSRSQKPGLGFPLIRMVVMLGFATAALMGCEIAPWCGKNNGEPSLLRRLMSRLRPKDVLVADAGFSSFWMLLAQHVNQVDVVVRLKHPSLSKSSEGKKLGRNDYEIIWKKPAQCPEWMDRETYAKLPQTLTLREIHTTVAIPGFRTQKVIVITTLLDTEAYPAADIAKLYRARWYVELDIRAIKSQLKMDILRGMTPEMLQREIWTHLLSYNLVRRLQAVAAKVRGCRPRQLSFAMAQKQLEANWEVMATCSEEKHRELVETCVQAVASRLVGNRPERTEPRRVKRRPKDAKRLTKPRSEARQDALDGKEKRETKKRRGKAAQGKGRNAQASPTGSPQ